MSVHDMPDQAPHTNPSLERQVLGQILAFRDGWDLYVGAGLRDADFFGYANRHVFRAIQGVAQRGITPDLATVGLELRTAGVLEEVNVAYYSLLVDGAVRPTAEAVEFIASELATLAARRALVTAVTHGELSEIAALVDAAQTRGTDSRRVYDAAGQLGAVRADIARHEAGRVWLGFPTLDSVIEGGRPSGT